MVLIVPIPKRVDFFNIHLTFLRLAQRKGFFYSLDFGTRGNPMNNQKVLNLSRAVGRKHR